jgi:hypothetical protein
MRKKMKANLLFQAVGNIFINERVTPSDITDTIVEVFDVSEHEFHSNLLTLSKWLKSLDGETLQSLQDTLDNATEIRPCKCPRCASQQEQEE